MRFDGDQEVVELLPGGRPADPAPVQDIEDIELGDRRDLWRAGLRERIARNRAVHPIVVAVTKTVTRVVGRIPRRTRVVVALLAIAAAGFAALGVAGTHVVRGYLTDRADTQLRETSTDIGSTPFFIRPPGFGMSGEPDRRATFFYDRSLPQGVAAQLRSANGAFVREYGLTSWSGASGPLLPGDLSARTGRPFTVPARATGDHWRVLVTTPVEGSTLVVAANVTAADAAVSRLTEITLIAGGLALAVMAFVGLRVARSGTGRLAEIERTVEAAVAGDLSRRVSVPADGTGPVPVAHAVNALIEQIGDARAAEERALRRVGEADRAVRLPLSVIKGFADYYRDAPRRDPVRMARLVDRVDDEATRIGVVLENLLADLSRTGNGHGTGTGGNRGGHRF